MALRIEKTKEGFAQYYGWIVFLTVTLFLLPCMQVMANPQDQGARNAFNSTCASCHGQNGVPTTVGKGLKAPDLGSAAVQKETNAQLQQVISAGKGNMPPFSGSLSESEINSLVAYIRKFSKRGK